MAKKQVETIAAPITAPGQAGVSVVRVSGPACKRALQALCSKSVDVIANPREMTFQSVLDPLSGKRGEVLDHGMVVFFPAPKSFTGEDCAEFHLHGSPYLVRRLLENLNTLGVRSARAGEFSERAFLNGRIDLAQAEAVADLIAAETAAQAKVATEQLAGKLSQAISELGEPLRELLAQIEAFIDFPEEDIEPLSYAAWKRELSKVEQTLNTYIASFETGKLYREGAQVVLSGLPNAGKSSLLNRLVGEDRAIVTPIPGTTRDSIEERITLNGLYVRLWDTAGLEDEAARKPDTVEKLGIARSWKHAEQADLVLFIFDGTQNFETQLRLFEKIRALKRPLLVVANKADLLGAVSIQDRVDEIEAASGSEVRFVSALAGIGISELCDAIVEKLLGDHQASAGQLLICNARHKDALVSTVEAIKRAKKGIADKVPSEFIALEVRTALNALSEIIGLTHTEDILGRIFSKFCIGK